MDASILNRVVLLYAVPLMLFAGTVSTPRAADGQSPLRRSRAASSRRSE